MRIVEAGLNQLSHHLRGCTIALVPFVQLFSSVHFGICMILVSTWSKLLYSRVSERSRFQPVEPPADFNRVHCQQHLPGLERELALNPSNVQVDQEGKVQGQVKDISKV